LIKEFFFYQTHFYDHIRNEEDAIVSDIVCFFENNIVSKFELPDYVFDVVRERKSKVKLIDFNPFGRTTDGILFDWDELQEIDENSPSVQFRYESISIIQTLFI